MTSRIKGLSLVCYFDCPGGGQLVVRDGVAYVGHVKPPDGTTLIDLRDPAKPRKLSEIKVPEGTLSHKVRVDNGVMLVNREINPIGRKDPDFKGGLEIFDVANPSTPRHVGSWPTRGHHLLPAIRRRRHHRGPARRARPNAGAREFRELEQAMSMVTDIAAKAARVTDYGIAAGNRADLVVVGAPSVHEAIRLQSPRRHVFKAAREVAHSTLKQELVTS